MSVEQSFQRLELRYQQLEDNYKTLEQQLILLENYRNAMNMSQQAILGLKNIKQGKDIEIMLPLGNTAFIRANVIDSDKIIVAIGKDVFIEKTREQAMLWIRKLEENNEKTRVLISNQIGEISNQLIQTRSQLQQYYNQAYNQMNQIKPPGDPGRN